MIPVIIGAIAAGTTLFGLAKGKEGVDKIREAKKMVEDAFDDYNYYYSKTSQKIENFLNNELKTLGETRIKLGELKKEMYNVLKKVNVRIKKSLTDQIVFEDIETGKMKSLEDFTKDLENDIKAQEIVWDLVKAGKTGIVTYIGATGLVAQFGTASTGTAISTLSGAAARNAILAWFGGGSVAAGGGGMALGSVILGGITIAPTVLMLGFSLSKKGEKALTEASKKVAEIKGEIKKMEAICRNIDYARNKISIFNELSIKIGTQIKEILIKIEKLTKTNFDENEILSLVKVLALLAPILRKALNIQVITQKEFALCKEVEEIISDMKEKLNYSYILTQ